MLLIYMLACRSVGGSEGFVIADAMLFHVKDSEYVEVVGSYEKQRSGKTWLWAAGGGKCPYFPKEERPEGEGWEKSSDEKLTDEERCALLGPYWYGGEVVSEVWSKDVNISISDDMFTAEKVTTASVTECVEPEEEGFRSTETVELDLDSADLKIHGDKGHITAKAGSKLVVDLTLPLCLVDY